VGQRQQRDLVIKLVWQGAADLDLKVEDPSGSTCSALQKQTVGGGTLIGDAVANMSGETYVAAQGFSGDYKVTVDRIWGKPLGNKAQLKIIRHQGTDDETEELVTVAINSNLSKPVTVKLEAGRRTEAAYVAPPEALQQQEDISTSRGLDAVMTKLRILSDPEITGFAAGGIRGGDLSGGTPRSVRVTDSNSNDKTLYRTKVRSFITNSVDLTAQAVISADRRSVRLSVAPVFNTATDFKLVPV